VGAIKEQQDSQQTVEAIKEKLRHKPNKKNVTKPMFDTIDILYFDGDPMIQYNSASESYSSR